METILKGNIPFGLLAIVLLSLNASLALGLSTSTMTTGNRVAPDLEKDRTATLDTSSVPLMPHKALPVVEAASRPVFSAERRPSVPTIAADVDIAPPPPPPPQIFDWTLAGINLSGSLKQALFAKPGLNLDEWHIVGDALDGWTISNIDGDKVALQSGSETLIRYLYQPNQ